MNSFKRTHSYDWNQIKDSYFNRLPDGVYRGITKKYHIFYTKKQQLYLALYVQIKYSENLYTVSHMIPFQFDNYFFKKLMKSFDIPLNLGEEPNLEKLCHIEVEVSVKTNGNYQNVSMIKPIIKEDYSDGCEPNVDDVFDCLLKEDDEVENEVPQKRNLNATFSNGVKRKRKLY